MTVIEKLHSLSETINTEHPAHSIVFKILEFFHITPPPITAGIWKFSKGSLSPQADVFKFVNSFYNIPCTETIIVIQGKEILRITIPETGITLYFRPNLEFMSYKIIQPIDLNNKKEEVLDLRILKLRQVIEDNNFDLILSDEDLMKLITNYGTEFAEEMILIYGEWRMNNPTKAKYHKSHYRAIINNWVQTKACKKLLPNPNDELVRLRPNVLVSKLEKKQLLKAIEVKLKEKDEHNQMEYLLEIATKLSAYKFKNDIVYFDQDANMILTRIEQLEQYKFNKN